MYRELLMGTDSVSKIRINDLLNKMTIEEKIGQLCLVNTTGGSHLEALKNNLKDGKIGAILNEVNPNVINELQYIAVKESRLGIPLLIGRDVIHGFKTIFPIPLGQAASWNPDIVYEGARISAIEAASQGINWTFAPMLDIGRDPRWGRVAETLGEDTHLISVLGAAMVSGFQGTKLNRKDRIASCAKHFAGYGASEGGRDYNTTNIPENELRNTHLPPFKAALNAGAATVMTSFSDLDGVPASANEFLLKQVLRKEWKFDGFVVSDWESIKQLSTHGLTPNDKESAFEAANAGLDMEMASQTYSEHLFALINESRISMQQLDTMVSNILGIKFRLGLFELPYTNPPDFPELVNENHLAAAKEAAIQSAVLLKNENNVLPIVKESVKTIAVIGPLADDGYEQLGTWVFDADERHSQTPLNAIKEISGEDVHVNYVRAMESTRSKSSQFFSDAIDAANNSDIVVLFLGEESILSGEAHCRADIGLPGNQVELIKQISATGKPIILVLMAGRALALENIVNDVDAILYAWHPGTMAGPAIADLLFGKVSPSGKLPVTFPRVTGQVPIYYSQKNTGKPVTPETYMHIDDIQPRMHQVSVGNTSYHLDTHYTPLFPFGFGLSYTEFNYSHLVLDKNEIHLGETININAEIFNKGCWDAMETVQLYIRDVSASVTRPVKELKGFKKISLAPGETKVVSFQIHTDDLSFHNRKMQRVTEPGKFIVWIGSSSNAELQSEFEMI